MIMESQTVVLIAFTEQDNLGVGYIGSILHQQNFIVRILDFRLGPQKILEHLRNLKPTVVGFSIIFQHFINDFRDMITYLRQNGITCHFSAGGHYPSLRYGQLLQLIPELDSVVLFEGEISFLELVQAISNGQDWENLAGLAYRDDGLVHANELRPLETDLDNFPPPIRQPLREFIFDKKFATLLAGRGCIYNCSFCSIREFYSRPPGPVKRVRHPVMVVKEMELLHRQKDCSIFMFQDDDFPITYKKGSWLKHFLQELDKSGLSRDIMWKINCRPDEIHIDTLEQMKARGLFLVYLGIESGTDEGLQLMNKRITAETNLNAAKTLKGNGIEFDYGYMLFDPDSTFERVWANLDFLDELVGDGSSPITFCKMLPYAGTKIEERLIEQGRLIGEVGSEDYLFYDPRLDRLYKLMAIAFEKWIGSHAGLLNLARWVRHFLMVYRHYFIPTDEFSRLAVKTKRTIQESNLAFTRIAREMVEFYRNDGDLQQQTTSADFINEVQTLHAKYCQELECVVSELEQLDRESIRL